MRKMLHGAQRSWAHCKSMCGRQKPEDLPPPICDNAIALGGIGGLESPVYICVFYPAGTRTTSQ